MKAFQVLVVALAVAVSRAGHSGGHGYSFADSVFEGPTVDHGFAAAPVHTGVIAHAPVQKVRTHEVHTSTGRQTIQLKEYQAGDQLIRVHEGPQAPPQVDKVLVPGEKHHVRVVNHASGPAHLVRKVHRQPTQEHNLHKPGRPGVRVVQVVRGHSPAPSVEFVNVGDSDHHVYHAHDTEVLPTKPVAVRKLMRHAPVLQEVADW